MQPSIEQLIREFREASAAIRLRIGDDPAKAREFLESAGIKLPPAPPSDTANGDQADGHSRGVAVDIS